MIFRYKLLACALAAIPAVSTFASPVTPGDFETAASIHSIGIEWAVSGDADHDAAATVEYRPAGMSSWSSAMNLVRVDSDLGNSLAGSIMFLQPGTEYEVRVSLSDPDGGADMRVATVTTSSIPTRPTPVRTLHVVPGAGGGDGSSSNPYRGLPAAWANAQGGDELLLHAGTYGGVNDDNGHSGDAGNPIVIRAAGDGEVVFSYLQVFQSNNLWFEGLTFRHDGASDTGFYSSLLNPGYDTGFQPMRAPVSNIVLSRNRFEATSTLYERGRAPAAGTLPITRLSVTRSWAAPERRALTARASSSVMAAITRWRTTA